MDKRERDIGLSEIQCLVCKTALSERADCRICSKCFGHGLPLERKSSDSEITIDDLVTHFKELDSFEEHTRPQFACSEEVLGKSPKRMNSEAISNINPEKKNCQTCLKKIGILGFKCNHCSLRYCKSHRLPESHDCEVDFISLGRKKLKVENPQISFAKITKF